MSALMGLVKSVFGTRNREARQEEFRRLFKVFQEVLALNNQVLDIMATMGTALGGNYVFDQQYIRSSCSGLADRVNKLINYLNAMAPKKYEALYGVCRQITQEIEDELSGKLVIPQTDYTIAYRLISMDFVDVVGAKNAHLSEVGNMVGLPTPDGFAITTMAFKAFLDYNGLSEQIAALIQQWDQNELSGEKTSKQIANLITSAAIPPALARSIEKAVDALYRRSKDRSFWLALRSSAMGEDDTDTSFAGQYLSLLNISPNRILHHYKRILAGAYSEYAMEYRKQKGFMENEVAMAVGCQRMIDAKASGVLYTLDPRAPDQEVMVLSATWGLGAPVVAGEVKTDQYTVSRKAPYPVTAMDIVRKERELRLKHDGGTEWRTVDNDLQTKGALDEAQVRRIAEAGLLIEKHFKKPQDIEWLIDQEDRLVILQARQLNISNQLAELVCDLSASLKKYPVIFENRGTIAQEGIGAGEVCVVRSDDDLDAFPSGAVLVSEYTSPRFAKVIRKANAVITDIGSPTGHMATIAREFRVPAIVDTGIATHLLKPGQEITVDARQNVVYEGSVKELHYCEYTEPAFEETYEYRLLRRVLKKIAPLNLLDPSDKTFVATACRTYHDITRFVHEKAVEQLLHMEYSVIHGAQAAGRRLNFNVPLALILIDIGGGLNPLMDVKTVRPQEVASVPMKAFLEGLELPGAWDTEPVPVDFGGFMSSLTRTFAFHSADPKSVGQNLAVVTKEYANISLRLGYHFNMIDAYACENKNDNYVYFRFLGGVTDTVRRSRRARLLAEILTRNHFRTDVKGDLVVARAKKLDVDRIKKLMRLIGLIVAYTRQLDVKMISESEVDRFVLNFETLKGSHSNSIEF